MKKAEKEKALQLRREGLTFSEIRRQIPVSKGTLSLWLRGTILSQDQLDSLTKRSASARAESAERVREVHRTRRLARWASFREAADREWAARSRSPTFLFGLALYAGEGAKTRWSPSVSNCDPRLLIRTIEFFNLLGFETKQLRAGVHIHDRSLAPTALKYWSDSLGLLPSQFHKPVISVSRSSKRLKPNAQPFGTAHVMVHSTELLIKILRWIDLSLEKRLDFSFAQTQPYSATS